MESVVASATVTASRPLRHVTELLVVGSRAQVPDQETIANLPRLESLHAVAVPTRRQARLEWFPSGLRELAISWSTSEPDRLGRLGEFVELRRLFLDADAWLRGQALEAAPKHPEATAEKVNPWYYSDAPRTLQPLLDAVRRQSTFDEVVGGLDASNALFEARRCLSCGNCFECDNCYAVRPDNAVIKLGPGRRYEFDYDYCKGCALCAAECPCGAIEMVPEPS